MLQKKICMLGAFGVGKTSLVRRYVQSLFSDAYLTTVGVKIDKKTVTVGNETVTLLLWDIAGEDDVSPIRMSYLRGAAGYLLVADGTRAETLDIASSIQSRVKAEIGTVPFLVLLNKADLQESWEIGRDAMHGLEQAGWSVVRTSARTGAGSRIPDSVISSSYRPTAGRHDRSRTAIGVSARGSTISTARSAGIGARMAARSSRMDSPIRRGTRTTALRTSMRSTSPRER